jgi:hypothetical protein
MKKRHISSNSGIKHRDIRRKAYKSYVSHKPYEKRTGNKWDWDDEWFISDLGF